MSDSYLSKVSVPLLFDKTSESGSNVPNGAVGMTFTDIASDSADGGKEIECVVSFSFRELAVERVCSYTSYQLRTWYGELKKVQRERMSEACLFDTDHGCTLCCLAMGNNATSMSGEMELANYLNPKFIGRSQIHETESAKEGRGRIGARGVACDGVRVVFGNGFADEEATTNLIRGLAQLLVSLEPGPCS